MAVATGFGPAAARPRGGLRRVGIYPLLAVLFATWAAGSLVGLGGPMRPLFPVATAAAGGALLLAGRRADFLSFTLWLFMLTPFLRRVVDLHAGWSQVNLLMLAPYATAVLAGLPVARALTSRRFAYGSLFAVLLGSVAYGLAVASVNGRFTVAAFETLRWAVPPILGLLVAIDPEQYGAYRDAVTRTMVVALIVLSAYGIAQFILAPAWDQLWMVESKLLTIGFPEPYQIRVFGTMNSPASLAAYLMAGLLWVIPSRSWLRPASIGLGLVALLLTLVRTSWLGLAVGVLYLVVLGASARARLSIIVGIVCLPAVVLGLEQIPKGAEIIDSRLTSLTAVGNDTSFLDRSSDYSDFFNYVLPAAPMGSGFGLNGSYQDYLDQHGGKLVDGAVMEIGTALGVFVGGAYLLSVLAIAWVACWASIRGRDTFLSSCGAIVAALTLSLIAGTVTVGETGILYWLAAGFCIASALAARQRVSHARPD